MICGPSSATLTRERPTLDLSFTNMDAERKAALEVGDSPCSLRAVFMSEVGHRGLDGAMFRLAVADPWTTARMDVAISGTNGGHFGMVIDPELLEAAVEKRAGSFPLETRLRDLVACSPLAFRLDDLLAPTA